MINSRLHSHNYTFDSRWVSVYVWAFVSIWVSIYLHLGIWVGEETKWMGSSLIKKCKTMCHSLSLSEVEPVNIFLGKLTLGRQEAECRQMAVVVGKMTDKPSFPSSGYENLGNGMQINSFTLIVKKKNRIFTHLTKMSKIIQTSSFFSVISKYLYMVSPQSHF